MCEGTLVSIKVAQGELAVAQMLLAEALRHLPEDGGSINVNGSLISAEVQLHLASGQYEAALERIDPLIDLAQRSSLRLYLPETLWLQAKAYLALSQPDRPRPLLTEARDMAEEYEMRVALWPVLVTLMEMEDAQGNEAAAAAHRRRARVVTSYIAGHAGDDHLRATFLKLVGGTVIPETL